jgi:glycosyltransferase involved in cell wall biosynthesis
VSQQKYTFHILGIPHCITSKEFNHCAYTTKVFRFAPMMRALGHRVIHYGCEGSTVECDEHVSVTTPQDLEIAYGPNYRSQNAFFKFDMNDHVYRTFYANAIREIGLRKQKNDFLLPFWGMGHKPVCDAHSDLIVVEPGIGYAGGHFATWRVYESYAIRAAVGGAQAVAECKESWYHAVIPNYFDPNDFVYSDIKSDYFLFLGRVYPGKGADVAIQICEKLGKKLILAGQGSLSDFGYHPIPGLIEHVGYADVHKRQQLMANAKGFFLISMYSEPFGGAAVEAMFSGTPIITSDWGVFPETNIHGITGFRCRTFDQFCWATENIQNIKPINCRNWALNNYSMSRVGEMYNEYFQMVHDVYTGNGWYQEHPERTDLNWLNRYYNFE